MIRKLWFVLLTLWQLPQSVLALFVFLYVKAKGLYLYTEPACISGTDGHSDSRPRRVVYHLGNWGVSLGEWVFVTGTRDRNPVHLNPATLLHELGHSEQSVLLGPLYLLAVGIPSAVFNNLWDRWFHGSWTWYRRVEWYYSRYPEKWADGLAGLMWMSHV